MQVGYDREQRLMLGFVHNLGEQRARDLLMQQPVQQKYGPTSWLAQQRRDVRICFHSLLITNDAHPQLGRALLR